jgi:hypothetical protein
VLALTVLVVRLGAAGAATTGSRRSIIASQSGDSMASRGGLAPTASAGAVSGWIAGPAIAMFHGTGPARNDQFAVGRAGTWGLAWTFRCSAQQPGNFKLTAKRTTGEGVELDIAGPTGQGIIWNTGGAGLHYLNVSSACSWTARVVVPRPPKRNS